MQADKEKRRSATQKSVQLQSYIRRSCGAARALRALRRLVITASFIIWICIWITWMPRPDKVVHTGQIPYFPSYIIGDGAGAYHCVRICYSIVASCNFYHTRGLLICHDPILSAWPALCVQAILFQSFKYLIFKIIFLDAFLFL